MAAPAEARPHPLIRDESEQHVIHRLEAFSDIVIGFGLAQLSLSLVLPNHAVELFTKHGISLLAFGVTFAIVSLLWWSHHRLFTHYFVPTPVNIVLNFTLLAGILFLIYTLQIYLRVGATDRLAYCLYFGTLAFVLAVNAVLTFRGVLLRGASLPAELLRRGKARALRLALVAVFLVGEATVVAMYGVSSKENTWLAYGFIFLIVALRVTGRLRERRIVPAGSR